MKCTVARESRKAILAEGRSAQRGDKPRRRRMLGEAVENRGHKDE